MKKVLFVTLVLTLVLSIALSACGGSATETPAVEEPAVEEPAVEEPAAEEPMEEPTEEPMEEPTEAPMEEPEVEPAATLRIWADDTRTPILLGLADDFLAEYNVELVVEDLGVVQDIRSQAIIAIPAGEGPDIFIGVHDWLGAMVDSGLVAPIESGRQTRRICRIKFGCFHLY